MRKIKFRAWDGRRMIYEPRVLEGNLNDLIKEWQENKALMQFIGLLDKNGREIYEGDIIKSNLYSYDEEIFFGSPVNGVREGENFRISLVREPEKHRKINIEFRVPMLVIFNKHIGAWDCEESGDLCFNFEEAEIIGNIYETPELLTRSNNG